MLIVVCSKEVHTIESIRKLFSSQDSIQVSYLADECAKAENLPPEIDLLICDVEQLSNGMAIDLMDREIPVIALKQKGVHYHDDHPTLQYIDKPLNADDAVRLLHAVSAVFRVHQILKAGRLQRQLLDSIPDIVMVLDSQYRVIRINRAMLVHLSPQGSVIDSCAFRSVLGRKCHELMFSRIRPCHEYGDNCPLIGMNDDLPLTETMITFNDRHFHLTMTPLIEVDEKPLYFVEVIRDITSQVSATHALEIRYAFEQVIARASAEMIQNAEVISQIDGVSLAMNRIADFIKADHWYLTECNPDGNAWNVLFENASESRRSTMKLPDPGLFAGWDMFQKKILMESSILHIPNTLDLPSDVIPDFLKLNHVKSIVLIPFLRGEKVLRILGFETHEGSFDWPPDILIMFRVFGEVINNAVDRNRNALKLRREEARYRRLTDNLPDLVWRIRQNGIIEYVNPAIETLLGHDRDAVIGTSIDQFLPDSIIKRVTNMLSRIGETEPVKKYFRFKEEFRRKDGHIFPCEIGITFDRDDSGNIIAYEGIIRDLSESRQAEREKADLQQQFHRAQRLEAVGRMASGLAHEINNPIGIIIGFAEFLIDSSDLATHQIENIRLIHQEAVRIKELTQRLLDFARSEALEMKSFDIHQTVSDCIKLIAHTFKRRNVLIQTHFDETAPKIQGDANALKQVFMNLLINALEAIPTDIHGLVEIRTSKTESAGVKIEISDNGIGIQDDLKDRIFDPFFSGKEQGSGLGLSISTSIIEKHNGTLTCKSKVGVGTTFILELPSFENNAIRPERRIE